MAAKYAVFGNPIAHSLSPQIHKLFAKQFALEISYERIWAPDDGFVKAAETFSDDGGEGFNVTAPFKQDAFNWVTELDDLAAKAKAVNTVQIEQNQRIGYNTDGMGLVADLSRLEWDLEEQRVLILGAGGATMGILQPLLDAGCEVTVANRTFDRAKQLQSEFAAIQVSRLEDLESGWNIIINATSATRANVSLPVAKSVFKGSKCYDLTYSLDGKTPFLNTIADVATVKAEGLGMLVEQAAAAFRIWFGVQPETSIVLEELRSPKTTGVRRFIAGGKCERCGAEDKIYIEYDEHHNPMKYGCHACGFTESKDGTATVQIFKPQ